MCGIAGWIGQVSDGQRVANGMRTRLHHRGPDDSGVREFNGATLVHTRLSILDLSPEGHQPLGSADGRIWTVFNGEIYNHRELRRGLQERGFTFRGHSDSEVIPALYLSEGPDFVARLRGMFALAVYDTQTKRLLLARDRFGIKPLFYAQDSERLAFASEIRALRGVPGLDDRPDYQAAFDYCALGYIAAPDTILRGVRSLEPCQVLEAWFEGDRVRSEIRRYHQWVVAPKLDMSFDRAVEQAEHLLNTAVERQLESDVPLGSLLSGGIDSSLVSAAASRVTPSLRTFNVRFPEGYDETWAALAVSRHLGTAHETLAMEDGEASWERVTSLLAHTGQPFADPSLFAVNAVSRLMRQHVTVALSGDGGDEGFGGYDISWRLSRFASLQRLPNFIWHVAAAVADPLASRQLIRGWLPERLRDLPIADDALILRNMATLMREREQEELFGDTGFAPTRRHFASTWPNEIDARASRVERLSAHFTEVNIRLILANGYLFKVDSASMRESLEVRVPMLDEDLIAFGLTLPHDLKVQGQTGKRVLRSIASRWLPQEIATKPKGGFAIPIDSWVDKSFKTRLRETLLSPSTPLRQLCRPEVYQPWITSFCDGHPPHDVSRESLYRRALALLSLHLALCPSDT